MQKDFHVSQQVTTVGFSLDSYLDFSEEHTTSMKFKVIQTKSSFHSSKKKKKKNPIADSSMTNVFLLTCCFDFCVQSKRGLLYWLTVTGIKSVTQNKNILLTLVFVIDKHLYYLASDKNANAAVVSRCIKAENWDLS